MDEDIQNSDDFFIEEKDLYLIGPCTCDHGWQEHGWEVCDVDGCECTATREW